MRDVLTDARLPHLATLVDTSAMSRLFEAHFRDVYPEREIRVAGSSIEKVYYRLEKHGSALHRLRLRGGGADDEHWFFARHYPRGEGSGRFAKALRRAGESASFWQPVSYWPELEMLIWAFPHDPRLRQLPELIREGTVASLVEEHGAALGFPAGSACAAVRWRQVKYMPRKRCVLRFEVDVETPRAGPRTLAFYSKTYADSSSRYVFEAMEAARQTLGARPPLEIPRSLLHLDRLHTYWQEEWPGESLSRLYGTPELEPALPRVAHALAELHGLALAGLPEAFYVDAIGAEALEDAAEIGRFLPADADRVAALGERIRDAHAGVGAAAAFPAVPLHGAYRMSQLLGRGDRVAMTDFDAVALGDPHYDVAEFMASLLYQRFRRNLPLERLAALCERFRGAYESFVPWSLDPRRLACFVAAFLLEKLHGTLKGLELAIVPNIDGVLELAECKLGEASRR